jgi:hypothetical protein
MTQSATLRGMHCLAVEQPAEAMNRECNCSAVDLARLRGELEHEFLGSGLCVSLLETHPHLFSSLPVFVAPEQVERMAAIIAAVESVVALPAYRERVLAWAPESARHDPGPLGVFLGYDFHAGADGVQLIEINTNAGGALLNLVLARAQRACCAGVEALAGGTEDLEQLEGELVAMFREEWRRQRGDAPLASIAIVDEDPARQYLYPEFLLFQRLFQRHGIEAVIADPRELELRDGALWARGRRVDLVYNRLTDFGLEQPQSAALRGAWREGAAVVTPHPRAHALYADKRNLAALGDAALLAQWGVAPEVRELLAGGIPRTVVVDPAHADELWRQRRRLFFKPAAGFGSRGSYRGEKLTKKVFEEILRGGYVAQEYAPPGERLRPDAHAPVTLKVDLRNYVYAGKVQLVAARLYQGQTTNFRTPGGGFAPLFYPSAQARAGGGYM